MSKREQILQALFEKLQTLENIPVKRNETLPQVIPEAGIVMLRDGKQGEPEIILSPPICIFKHEAEVEIIVQAAKPEERDRRLDDVLEQLGVLLSSDDTLRGLSATMVKLRLLIWALQAFLGVFLLVMAITNYWTKPVQVRRLMSNLAISFQII